MNNRKIKIMITSLSLILSFSMVKPTESLAAWKQDSTGWWNTEGNSYSIGWRLINGSWYYFGSDGYMKTGWVNDNNTWYYLSNSGAMKTGWINDNNKWYFLESSGAMKTGWINDKGTWYYTNESGVMQTGFISVNNKNYYLNESGAMVTGDITINGVKYTFAQNGEQISSSSTNNNLPGDNTIENTIPDKENIVAGLGGGGGAASSGQENGTFLSYSDLYGEWIVDSALKNTGISTSLTGYLINSAIGQVFTVDENKIETSLGTVENPTVKENILTNAEFKSKWGVNLSRLGISGNSVNCITLSALDNDNIKRTGHVIVDNKNRVFAMVKGTVFRLKRN